MEITFTNMMPELQPSDYLPKPARDVLPDWYKETNSYIEGEKTPVIGQQTSATIKRCVPVFDAVSSGYILFTSVDIYVHQRDGAPYYQWKHLAEAVSFHDPRQAPKYPGSTGKAIAKFISPWSIKTPRGYSCLFTQPMHHDVPFNIFPGIVDTDVYHAPVNFIFTLKDNSWEGLIPVGTPMVQVIPFKRDEWKMRMGDEADKMEAEKSFHVVNTRFFDGYRKKLWVRKQYR